MKLNKALMGLTVALYHSSALICCPEISIKNYGNHLFHGTSLLLKLSVWHANCPQLKLALCSLHKHNTNNRCQIFTTLLYQGDPSRTGQQEGNVFRVCKFVFMLLIFTAEGSNIPAARESARLQSARHTAPLISSNGL